MPVFRQPLNHTLNATKGWPNPYGVDMEVALDSSITGIVPAGRVGQLNSDGKWIPGVSKQAMALFVFSNSDDPHVGGEATPSVTADTFNHTQVIVARKITTFPAKAAIELETTEFTGATTDYPPNTALRADASTSNDVTNTAENGISIVDGGKVSPGTVYVTTTVGVTSVVPSGVEAGYGSGYDPNKSVIRFWPVYLPRLTTEAAAATAAASSY